MGESFAGHIVAATDLTGQRGLAEALQRSLLPDVIPDVPGALFCTRYQPGGKADLGGDWYDVIPLPNRRHGVAIGDVVGHGVRAAAAMGQLRQALRVDAAEGYSAAAVVERLNRFVFLQGPIEMATLCYGVLDADAGTFDFASAGHLPPLRIPAAAPPHYAESRPSPPIGAAEHTGAMRRPCCSSSRASGCSSTPTDWWSGAASRSMSGSTVWRERGHILDRARRLL